MSVTFAARAVWLSIGVVTFLLTAEIGSANYAPAEGSTAATKSIVHWDVSTGRLCPSEVGYGKFEQPITVQDI